MTHSRIVATVVLRATAMLCLAMPLSAQGGLFGRKSGLPMPGRRLVNVAVSGGVTLPVGEFESLHESGFHIEGALMINIPGVPVAIRPEISFASFNIKQTALPSVNLDAESKTEVLSGVANFELPLIAGFYLVGGFGAMNLQTKLAQESISTEKATNLFLDAGAGVRFAVRRISGFIETRLGSASFDEGKFGYAKAQFIPVTFGLVF